LTIQDRIRDNKLGLKGKELDKIQEYLEFWLLKIDKLSDQDDDKKKTIVIDDSEEQFKQKTTLTNFFYPKEFTIEDSGKFLELYSIKPDDGETHCVMKFKRTAKLLKITEEDRFSTDFELLCESLIKYQN